MNERDLQVLEQYPFTVNASWRTRGGFLLETSMGRLLIREFSGSTYRTKRADWQLYTGSIISS